ncbi:hypothetical protein [Actinoplanes sp. NPDC049681]|uniref:hypothetical protein n=1 Tax=Actinoplanes sp. NPDC049681 TaxID=3363905 RepID=UPI0037AB232E
MIAFIAAGLVACLGILIAMLDDPNWNRRVHVDRLSVAVLVAGGALVVAGLARALGMPDSIL